MIYSKKVGVSYLGEQSGEQASGTRRCLASGIREHTCLRESCGESRVCERGAGWWILQTDQDRYAHQRKALRKIRVQLTKDLPSFILARRGEVVVCHSAIVRVSRDL